MITAQVFNDFTTSPRVELTLDAVAGAVSRVVTRTFGGSTSTVRGATDITSSGTTIVTDHEVPFGVDVTWTLTGKAADGTLIDGGQVTTVLDPELPSDQLAVIQDPLRPAAAWPVVLTGSSVSQLTYSRGGVTGEPIGSQDRIYLADQFRGAEGIPLGFYSRDGDEANALRDMLLHSGVLLVRSVPPIELPRLAYIEVRSFREVPIDKDHAGYTQWLMEASLVRAPAAEFAVYTQTWRDVLSFGTWRNVKAQRTTWLDLKRDATV